MRYSFEFCALNYLRQWFSEERDLHHSVNSTDQSVLAAGLARAVKFFGVARNLRKEFDVDRGLSRFEPLIDIYTRFSEVQVTESNFIEVLNRFSSALAREYGAKELISLSSKLLWLRFQDPFIIYDRRARSSLGTPPGDYTRYVSAWYEDYEVHSSTIASVSAKLPLMVHYVAFVQNDAYVHETEVAIREQWFHKRVFDQYLWHLADVGT